MKYRLIWTLLFLVSLYTKSFSKEIKILNNGDEILVESPMQVQISYPHGDPSPSFTLYRGNYKVDDWIIKRIQMPADKQESLRWDRVACLEQLMQFFTMMPPLRSADVQS